ncbi:hypothetical protein ES703_119398 [subsurface metagenome]
MRNEALMEFVCGQETLAVVNTPESFEIYLPTSKTELMAMLIHDVWIPVLMPGAPAATGETGATACITRNKNSAFGLQDPSVIATAQWQRFWDAGPIVRMETEWSPSHYHFDPPVLVARDIIWLKVNSDNVDSVLLTAYYRIGYTLEKVSREAFIAALVS